MQLEYCRCDILRNLKPEGSKACFYGPEMDLLWGMSEMSEFFFPGNYLAQVVRKVDNAQSTRYRKSLFDANRELKSILSIID